jgi:catechol 2,3-dioxygenase-like lactoylglutathione lyase family enzyme
VVPSQAVVVVLIEVDILPQVSDTCRALTTALSLGGRSEWRRFTPTEKRLTFNPGWNQDVAAEDPFTDVRDLQRELKAKGTEFVSEADEGTTGPGSFVVLDPDGNPVLFDQRV